VNYVRATEPPGAILRKIAIQRITNNHNIPEGYSFDHDHVTEFAELLSHQLDMDELPEILIEEAFEIMKAGSAKIRAASNIEELWEAMADDEE
jgi:hypothetical protein